MAGAGLAGLTCAGLLARGGAEVEVFEASDGVGGRVRTDERDGFLLDRGFQVLFTAYPAVRRHLDLEALDLKPFDPGAIIRHGLSRTILSDPRRDPASLLPSLRSDAATLADKLRVLRLAATSGHGGAESAAGEEGPDSTTLECLRGLGFSQRIIETFFRPFYGGILLDRSLSTSCRVFRFTFRMLASGEVAVPARGMGEISKQLASRLPEGAVHLGCPVERILREDGRAVGVRAAGEEHEADAVVLATEAPVARRLAGIQVPDGGLGQVCACYATGLPNALGSGRKIVLDASEGPVDSVVAMDAISPFYAPPGMGLLSVVLSGVDDASDAEIFRLGVEGISGWDGSLSPEPLAVYRIPYAQFPQPPGFHRTLPSNRTPTPGLFLAGEYTVDSSINGAILSGERAAREVLAG
ncbi:NAD(P)/FAD-dependent oxidoreductase [Rubrobacter calidifluminis]|uniref:NAD(P)/FAD-dependent oxidoreductase n=1 Tax=Rubrobacter calidifluminis TaxID=1392640 RepID=UPI00235FCFEC|nr:NAD(P)/FAD-dependent oxidoreductase [Rubrobacter calidifluminis]